MNNNNTLKQRGLLSGERRFELKDGRYLFVDVKQLKRNKSYQLDLVALEPNSKFSFRINWPWLMEPFRVHAQVNQRTDEHVASDAAKEVKIESFHHIRNSGGHRPLLQSALIWLAA